MLVPEVSVCSHTHKAKFIQAPYEAEHNPLRSDARVRYMHKICRTIQEFNDCWVMQHMYATQQTSAFEKMQDGLWITTAGVAHSNETQPPRNLNPSQLQELHMKTDAQLQQDVMAELKWEPSLRAAQIGVAAKDGVITLTGTVDGYAKKLEAEDAVKRVTGVVAVVEKIEIKYSGDWVNKDDNDIASEIVSAFKWNWEVPSDKVTAKVENRWVTLEGELTWKFQSDAAAKAVRNLEGVAGVSNNITIKSSGDDSIEKADVESALERNWSVSDQDIEVKVSGHTVTLTGNVDSWHQKDEASRIAWNAPGVWAVANELLVQYD